MLSCDPILKNDIFKISQPQITQTTICILLLREVQVHYIIHNIKSSTSTQNIVIHTVTFR